MWQVFEEEEEEEEESFLQFLFFSPEAAQTELLAC